MAGWGDSHRLSELQHDKQMLGDRVKNAIGLRVDWGLAMFDARDIAVLNGSFDLSPGRVKTF